MALKSGLILHAPSQVGHRRDQYKRCAHLLEAVSQLLEHFSHYQDVPKLQNLNKRLAVVQVRRALVTHLAADRGVAVASYLLVMFLSVSFVLVAVVACWQLQMLQDGTWGRHGNGNPFEIMVGWLTGL